MIGAAERVVACVLVATLGCPRAGHTQSVAQQPPAIEEWAYDFTVLTMAPDGTWGAATDPWIYRAIFLAIRNCKAAYKKEIGCGAYMTTVRGGWSLAIRCGRHVILVADRNLAEAERQAVAQESELRERYAVDMSPCARVVTVDPSGAIAARDAEQSDSVGIPALRGWRRR
jgi:hypothetical protein